MPTDKTPQHLPWIMLVARTLLFLAWQGVIALLYFLSSSTAAWDASTAWWTVTATLTNLVCIYLLVRLFRIEGLRYRDLFRFQRETLKDRFVVVIGTGHPERAGCHAAKLFCRSVVVR